MDIIDLVWKLTILFVYQSVEFFLLMFVFIGLLLFTLFLTFHSEKVKLVYTYLLKSANTLSKNQFGLKTNRNLKEFNQIYMHYDQIHKLIIQVITEFCWAIC